MFSATYNGHILKFVITKEFLSDGDGNTMLDPKGRRAFV
jgi:hypothetical protein